MMQAFGLVVGVVLHCTTGAGHSAQIVLPIQPGPGGQTPGIGGMATGSPIPIEGVGGIGGIGGIIGGRKTWGPGGIGGCGSIPIASMQQAGNGIEAGITMMIAVRLANLLMNGQSHPAFVTMVLSLPQLHLPSLSHPHLPSSQHEHLLSLQQEHLASHFLLLLQHSSALLHCPFLQQEHFASYGL